MYSLAANADTRSAVMMFFPTSPNPRPADMNWSVVMYGFVTVVLLVYYFTGARSSYSGPVMAIAQFPEGVTTGSIALSKPPRFVQSRKHLYGHSAGVL